ncbi:precorrin-3B synthase [Corynebacterium mendelii]
MSTTNTPSPSHAISSCMVLGDRSRTDACPGAIAMHRAEDGFIGRIRAAGGHLEPADWEALAELTDTFGDGCIHLTTRGNLQIRTIGDADRAAFSQAVADAGFLAHPTHDRMRNIIVSGHTPVLHPLAHRIDEALCADPVVAGLAGRTLFGVDDGSGDVAESEPDFGAVPEQAVTHPPSTTLPVTARYLTEITPETPFRLFLGGRCTVLTARAADLPAVYAAGARCWQEIRGNKWRVAEQPAAHDRLLAAMAAAGARTGCDRPAATPAPAPPVPVGWHDNPDATVTLGAGLPFGALSSTAARLIAATGATTTATTRHTVMVHNLAEDVAEAFVKLAPRTGLVFDAGSPWLAVTACTGKPGCAKSLSDTRRDAAALVASGTGPEIPVHVSGCPRRCGHPRGAYTDYLAVGDGEYEITGPAAPPTTPTTQVTPNR